MTTDASRRRVRTTAIVATALVGGGVAVAVGANPFPTSDRPKDADVQALEQRERALATEARRVNAANAERWATYRTQLAQRRREIAVVQAANARAQAAYGSASGGYSGSSSGGSSYSAPQATYVPQAAPVASSGAS